MLQANTPDGPGSMSSSILEGEGTTLFLDMLMILLQQNLLSAICWRHLESHAFVRMSRYRFRNHKIDVSPANFLGGSGSMIEEAPG